MNYYLLSEISAFSILIPVVACCYRRDRLGKKYLPLAMLLALGLINELISDFQIRMHGSNFINSNLYTLAEVELMLWFFHRWHRYPARLYQALGITLFVVWLADISIVHSIADDDAAFKLLSFLVLSVLCMDRISYLMIRDHLGSHKTDLLLAFTFFCYFTYKGFIMVFALFPIAASTHFSIVLWLILAFFNIVVNLAITLALIWLPKSTRLT